MGVKTCGSSLSFGILYSANNVALTPAIVVHTIAAIFLHVSDDGLGMSLDIHSIRMIMLQCKKNPYLSRTNSFVPVRRGPYY